MNIGTARKKDESSFQSRAICSYCGWEGSHFIDCIEGRRLACPQCGLICRSRNFIQYLQDAFPMKKYRQLRCLEISSSSTSNILRTKFPKTIIIDVQPRGNELYADLTNLHYKDNSFDFIVCLDVIEHIQDDFAALSEMFRIIKPFGKAILHTPLWSKKGAVMSPEDINWSKYHLGSSGAHDVLVYRYYSCEALTDQLERVGFRVKEIRFIDSGLVLHQDVFHEAKKLSIK